MRNKSEGVYRQWGGINDKYQQTLFIVSAATRVFPLPRGPWMTIKDRLSSSAAAIARLCSASKKLSIWSPFGNGIGVIGFSLIAPSIVSNPGWSCHQLMGRLRISNECEQFLSPWVIFRSSTSWPIRSLSRETGKTRSFGESKKKHLRLADTWCNWKWCSSEGGPFCRKIRRAIALRSAVENFDNSNRSSILSCSDLES